MAMSRWPRGSYWLATHDRQWLERDCWPILRDTADFWVSRVSYNVKQKRYEIGKVVAVNESLIGVDNDAWTNAIAKNNLEIATAAAREVHQQRNSKWQEITSAMYIPESDWLSPLSTPYLRPPFQVIAETPRNQSTNFITGAGAFLQQFIFGYPGLRLTENGLERQFPTVLPPGNQRPS